MASGQNFKGGYTVIWEPKKSALEKTFQTGVAVYKVLD
jgi:hypothetical protein